MRHIHLPGVGNRPAILVIAQWVGFTCAALLAVIVLPDLAKVGVPGAPVTLLYVTIGVTVAVALVHLPIIFFRLPRRPQLAAYAALVGAFFLFGSYAGQMQAAYGRTPEGAKEAARQASEAARQQAADQAAKTEAAQEAADDKQASLDAQKPEACKGLVNQVVDGKDVLEIDNVAVETSYQPDEVLSCSGDAITSHGNAKVEFGVITTPQGKQLLSIKYH